MGTPVCDSQNLSLRFVWEMSKPQRLELLLEMQLESTDEVLQTLQMELLKARFGVNGVQRRLPIENRIFPYTTLEPRTWVPNQISSLGEIW
jgi:hypothetical protein